MGVSRKQSTPNFPKNEHFLPPDTHTYVDENMDIFNCAHHNLRQVKRTLLSDLVRTKPL